MEYGEIIGAVQHVASCAGSLRLVNCVGASLSAWLSPRCNVELISALYVGADRAQSFERQAGLG